MAGLVSTAEKILADAVASDDYRTALMGVHQARETLVALAKLTNDAKTTAPESGEPLRLIVQHVDGPAWRGVSAHIEQTQVKTPDA
jgi:hypothetical protein